jgi:hypothetical protein
MEVPAKRARLAMREFKLLDLDDNTLIMIIDKLDHKTKLQMMITCKKFERLIGSTHQFYKNFKLNWNEEKTVAKAHHCNNIQRKFGSVKIYGPFFISENSRIMEIIKRIGENVTEVHLDRLHILETIFLDMMKLLPNLSGLTISEWVNIYECRRTQLPADFKLTNLVKLELHGHKNLEFLKALLPASLKILKMGKFFDQNHSFWDTVILEKQTCLEELSLVNLQLNFSGFDPKNCNIKKLKVRELSFRDQSSYNKFSDFLKIQESLVDLEFHVNERESKSRNYVGVVTHLLSLKTLKKLDINWSVIFAMLSKTNFCNPSVATLTIKNLPSGDKGLPKIFPSVTHLKIHSSNIFLHLWPINSMTKIRKLEIDYMSELILVELELKEMRELIISRSDPLIHLASWRTFFKVNCQLETFHMPRCVMPIEYLLVTLENLPLLRSLELTVDGFMAIEVPAGLCRVEFLARYKKEQVEKTAKLIGENYDSFEHLKLIFCAAWVNRIVLEFLEKYYPDVKLQK